MGVKRIFENLTTNIEQKHMQRIVKRIEKSNHASGEYCINKFNESKKIIYLQEPITDIEDFDKIIKVLKSFNLNQSFKSNVDTLVKIYSKDKKSIIGYSLSYNDNVQFEAYAAKMDIMELLEFVIFLSENDISLENVSFSELKRYIEEDTNYQFTYPHHFKSVPDLDYMINIKWFLNFIIKGYPLFEYLCEDIEEFEKNCFLSSALLKIYVDVFFNNKTIVLEDLKSVIEKEDLTNINRYYSFYSGASGDILYNQNKFYINPFESTVYFTSSKYDKFLKSGKILYENSKFFISKYEEQMYLIFKKFDDDIIEYLKTNADIIKHYNKNYCKDLYIESLVYNTFEEHPIGILLKSDNNLVKDLNICPLNTKIKTTSGENIVTLIKNVCKYLESLYKEGYSFNSYVNSSDILCLDDGGIIIKKLFHKRVTTNIDKDYNLTNWGFLSIASTVFDILLKNVNYKVEHSKIIFEDSDNILFSFSPRVIRNFESFVLKGKCDMMDFYKGVVETIKNYTKLKDSKEFYASYVIPSSKIPINFLSNKQLSKEKNEFISFNIKRDLNVIKMILDMKKKFDKANISIYGMPTKAIYSKEEGNFITLKFDNSYQGSTFLKLSELFFHIDEKSNKDIIRIIINLLKLRRSNFNINYISLVSIDSNNNLCIILDNIFKLNKIKLLNCNASLWKKALDNFIKRLLLKIDFPRYKNVFLSNYDISDEDETDMLESLIAKLEDYYNSLNIKCKKHNFWYNKDAFCKECFPNDILVDLDKLKDVKSTNNCYKEYEYLYFGKKCALYIFNDNKAPEIGLYNQILRNMLDIQSEFYKQVYSKNSKEYVGFAYVYSNELDYFEINDIIDNKFLLKCIIGFIDFIQNLESKKLFLKDGFVKDSIYFSSNNLIVLKNICYIYKSYSNKNLSTNIIDFILKYLKKSESFDENQIELISGMLKVRNYEGAKKMIKDVIRSLNHYCKIHFHHFSNKLHAFCPKCFDKNILNYNLKEVEKCKVFSESGKEAIIYDIGKGLLAKVYRRDENGNFIDEVNILKKQENVSKLLNMPFLNNTLELGHNFELVNVEGIVFDKYNNFSGIIMKKKTNKKSIKLLTDRVHLKKMQLSRTDILEILISIGKAIEFCHQHQMYIGDISYNNILFDPNTKTVYLIDLDSINFGNNNKTVFTEQFVDPLSINKKGYAVPSESADWYAFATLAFYTLTLLHPFNGIYIDEDNKPMNLVKRKVNKISVLGNYNIKIPPIALSWEWMSNSLKSAFLDIFEKEKRYNITDCLVQELNMQNEYIQEVKSNEEEEEPQIVKEYEGEKVSDLMSILVKSSEEYVLLSKYVRYPWNNGSMTIESLEDFKKKFYCCKNDVVFSLADFKNLRCYYSNTLDYDNSISRYVSDIIGEDSANISEAMAGLAIPYTDTFLCIISADDNIHYLIKCEYISFEECFSTEIIDEYYDLPHITVSVNTKNGNNDINDLTNQYKTILEFLAEKYKGTQKVYIYFDSIINKWLIVPYGGNINSAFIMDIKEGKISNIDFPYRYLEENDIHFNNIIFFNDSIYYPSSQKICSINLLNDKYLEFMCEHVSNDSAIEIIRKGFRICNTHEVYDLVKKGNEEDNIN